MAMVERVLQARQDLDAGRMTACAVYRNEDDTIGFVDTWPALVAFRHLIGRPEGWSLVDQQGDPDEQGMRLQQLWGLVDYLVQVAIKGTPADWQAVAEMDALRDTKANRQASVVREIQRSVYYYHHADEVAEARVNASLPYLGLSKPPFSGWKPVLAYAVSALILRLSNTDPRFELVDPARVKHWIEKLRPLRSRAGDSVRKADGGASNAEAPSAAADLALRCGAFGMRPKEGESLEAASRRVATTFRNALKRAKPRT